MRATYVITTGSDTPLSERNFTDAMTIISFRRNNAGTSYFRDNLIMPRRYTPPRHAGDAYMTLLGADFDCRWLRMLLPATLYAVSSSPVPITYRHGPFLPLFRIAPAGARYCTYSDKQKFATRRHADTIEIRLPMILRQIGL